MTVNKDDDSHPLASPSQPPSTNSPPPDSSSSHERTSTSSLTPTPHRSELLDRARHFLSSPQVIHQDHESKRRFLSEKGLSDGEVQLLLREMVRASSLFVFVRLNTPPNVQPTTIVRLFLSPKQTNSLRSCPPFRRGCIPHLLHPICPGFSWAHSRCFHGWRGAPLPCSSSITYVTHLSLALANPKLTCLPLPLAHRSSTLTRLAIPASAPHAIGSCPSFTQSSPGRPSRQAHGLLAGPEGSAKGRVHRPSPP